MTLYDLLNKYQMTVTTAESCTGGLVASGLVDLAGISAFFKEGYVTYAPEAKERILGVPKEVIAQYGVVSVQTAAKMAEGAAKAANADTAIATTGVAGPDGGTKQNPVGTVCFGCFVKNRIYTVCKNFEGNRAKVRQQAAVFALDYLKECIQTFENSCEMEKKA